MTKNLKRYSKKVKNVLKTSQRNNFVPKNPEPYKKVSNKAY